MSYAVMRWAFLFLYPIYVKNKNIMKKLIIILFMVLFPLISYSMGTGYDEEELVTIVIKKADLEKVKSIVKVFDFEDFQSNNKEGLLYNNFNNQSVPLFTNEKAKKKWATELKISIGMGATYGLINQSFDVGPSLNVGYEFTF